MELRVWLQKYKISDKKVYSMIQWSKNNKSAHRIQDNKTVIICINQFHQQIYTNETIKQEIWYYQNFHRYQENQKIKIKVNYYKHLYNNNWNINKSRKKLDLKEMKKLKFKKCMLKWNRIIFC